MDYNPNSGGMKQSRHNIFEQNAHLIKFRRKSVAHWACLPSKALITTEVREAESVYKLHSMVNKNNLQHVGRVSSGQQRKVHW
jgi:hypothetical protein